MYRKKKTPARAVDSTRIDSDHGLRSRNCRPRWSSGEPSEESCREANGIISGFVDVGVGGAEACDGGEEKELRTALEFLDRGVDRESELVLVLLLLLLLLL